MTTTNTAPADARPALDEAAVRDFIERHRLPVAFSRTIDEHYLPLATWLASLRNGAAPLLVGINGAQGTGKSTLADFLELAFERSRGWTTAVLSIDDFYLTRSERHDLSVAVHPLLATRGVPGTHDTMMALATIERLQRLRAGESMALPRFDKSSDDRLPRQAWPPIAGPIDVIVLEGWCVGTAPQRGGELTEPVNALERDEDPDGRWRAYVNDQLRSRYAGLFSLIDVLVFLQAPDFESIRRWRLEQERKLADSLGGRGTALMEAGEIARFVQYYERLTRTNLRLMPVTADAVLELDAAHACVAHHFSN